MLPQKFLYEERHYFGTYSKIELIDNWLDIQETTGCIPYLLPAPLRKLSAGEWKEVEHSISALNLKPKANEGIKDGMEVTCWITFKKRLVKFDLINPEFEGFEELRKIINQLSMCEEYPKGVLSFD